MVTLIQVEFEFPATASSVFVVIYYINIRLKAYLFYKQQVYWEGYNKSNREDFLNGEFL